MCIVNCSNRVSQTFLDWVWYTSVKYILKNENKSDELIVQLNFKQEYDSAQCGNYVKNILTKCQGTSNWTLLITMACDNQWSIVFKIIENILEGWVNKAYFE